MQREKEETNQMSETSKLISYSGMISRAALAQIRTPPPTPTHIPIPHIEVVETLVETLSLRHIGVVGEEFAVSSDGMEMFGVLDLETTFEGCRFAIGIRNANNKRFRLSCTVGLRVFVCQNQFTASRAEPLKSTFDPRTLREGVSRLGFEIAEHLPPEERWTRYFGMPLPLAAPSVVH